MSFRTDQLAALVAIVDHGTFDAAARHLSVTPSAISQRIRALESQLGQVVLVRTTPVRTTAAGAVLLRLARQQQLLEREAVAELAAGDAPTLDLPVAVNADSLATWFVGVLAECAAWDDVALRLEVEDQDHSATLLRTGAVLGAVTSDPVAVQGCAVERLGTMRYLPVATPALARRHATGGGPDWAEMPVVRFNAKDELQDRLLAAHGVPAAARAHVVPSSEGFLSAVRAGLGWGAVPEAQLGDDLRTGRLVRLDARDRVDVPLYWQCWRLRSAHLDRITAAVRAAAGTLRR
ncbi:LysR family transcriptional regulator ArgP [Georgenia thermotolerans]|uniref:ArgP/LysG family DNA-binding transcriptional regulator n=1 Tax=Georgenia thermotolerans TaxID=527326 RepID=A0A7J5USS6_9MICO|nr:LysR family transcriptional regulator ArgP [Georgenia thermotolerans]KAE8765301.1 ArgP/LysG family DNA-binding transcriptional regulator [Georgenia thermotolerans]